MRCAFSTGFNLSSAFDPASQAVLQRHMYLYSLPIGCLKPLITISKLGQSGASHAHAYLPERQECKENILNMQYVYKNAMYVATRWFSEHYCRCLSRYQAGEGPCLPSQLIT